MMNIKLELVAYAVAQIEEISRAKMACGEGIWKEAIEEIAKTIYPGWLVSTISVHP
jgi:hypothetical protein